VEAGKTGFLGHVCEAPYTVGSCSPLMRWPTETCKTPHSLNTVHKTDDESTSSHTQAFSCGGSNQLIRIKKRYISEWYDSRKITCEW